MGSDDVRATRGMKFINAEFGKEIGTHMFLRPDQVATKLN